MRTLTPLALVAALGWVVPAAASEVDATATTYMALRPEAAQGNTQPTAPLFELLDVSARKLEVPYTDDVRVKLLAWGRWDALDAARDRLAGDLQLAFAEGHLLGKRLVVRAGRQLVFIGGAPRVTHIDGGYFDLKSSYGLGARAYAGALVVPRFAGYSEGSQYGGRVYYAPRFGSEVGASYTYGRSQLGEIARNDVGADGRWAFTRSLVLSANAIWALGENRFVEAELMPKYSPLDNLDVWGAVRRTSPDLFLPRTSILAVFAEDTRDAVELGTYYEPIKSVGVTLDARGLLIPERKGLEAGGRVAWTLGTEKKTRLGGEVRTLKVEDSNGYLRGRLTAIQKLNDRLSVSADGEIYGLDQPVNGETRSYTGGATVTWAIYDGWRAALNGVASRTPMFSERFEVMGKLAYDFSWRGTGGATP